MKPRSPLSGFLLRVLLWAPVCFVAWYFLAETLLVPVRWLSELFLLEFFPHAVSAIEQQGISYELVTPYKSSLLANYLPGQPVGLITFNIEALKYCYGTPLYAAMTLAVANKIKLRVGWLLIGIVALIPFQCWGVVTDALVTLSFKLGNGVAAELGLSRSVRESLALSYQLGYLILPPLVPILLWGGLNRQFLNLLAPNLRKVKSQS